MRQGISAFRATGTEWGRASQPGPLAEAYGKMGQAEEGLGALAEALEFADKTGERYYEAELYRLKGELTLQQFNVQGSKFKVDNPQLAAETCFLKAIEIAQQQQAKLLELRAVMSLVRLRQQQAAQPASRITDHASRSAHRAPRNRLNEAHTMLSEIYHWFTE